MRELKKELWPHKVIINHGDHDRKIETWLHNSMGVYRERWCMVEFYEKVDFYFKSPQDATLFILKWS